MWTQKVWNKHEKWWMTKEVLKINCFKMLRDIPWRRIPNFFTLFTNLETFIFVATGFCLVAKPPQTILNVVLFLTVMLNFLCYNYHYIITIVFTKIHLYVWDASISYQLLQYKKYLFFMLFSRVLLFLLRTNLYE